METENKRFVLEFHIKEREEFSNKSEGIQNVVFPMSLETLNAQTITRAFDMGKQCVLKYLDYYQKVEKKNESI